MTGSDGLTPGVERVRLSAVRRRIAGNLVASLAQSAPVTIFLDADFTRVEQDRRAMHVNALAYVASAVCAALADFPHLNALLDGDTIEVHAAVHLGIAVDLENWGLVVPVIRNAHSKPLPALAAAIVDAAQRARDRSLKSSDLVGATFTVSNPGRMGPDASTPILPPRQTGILALGRVRKRAVVIEGPDGDELAIRFIGCLSLTFDHRAIDGLAASEFLHRVRELIESSGRTGEEKI